MSRPGLEPGPPAWEANALEKSHLDSLYAGYSEPLLMMRLAPFIQTSTEPMNLSVDRIKPKWGEGVTMF
jgi:hypothetical protein